MIDLSISGGIAQIVLNDSYEAQQNTWTPAMMTEFERRRGYSLLPWMPALTGQNHLPEQESFSLYPPDCKTHCETPLMELRNAN